MSKKQTKAKNNTLIRCYRSKDGTIFHMKSNQTKPIINKYDKKVRKIVEFKLISGK